MQADSARLAQSQSRLGSDQSRLNQIQAQSQQVAQAAPRAAAPPPASLPAAVQAPRPQLNAQGQSIGKLIDVTA
ncbi:MAG TPA: hypothetical protein DCW29_16200 [Janthinobacterium sp.]|nr:hypothetical protein [Janthinobacterium sp.]